jgi:(R,R)-butanediol dehydrogenase/meso-butanediol dehydrogenase/diacetyl reductase
MPAAVLRGPGVLEVEDVPVPELGPNDVLVEVDRCGVCGSDLHLVLEGWGQAGSIPGHEWTGVVADVGTDVTLWRAGDAVVGGPTVRCGHCRHCRAGRPSLCAGRDTPGVHVWKGAFARYTSAPEGELLALPDGLASRTAALTEPLAVALHGITRSGARPGDRVLVSGAGPIGALTIAALRALGVDDVVCVEPGEQRRLLAEEAGATQVRTPDELDQPTIAEPGRVVDDPFDVALECSGNNRAMEAALGQLERGGMLVLVGNGMHRPKFDNNRIVLNEVMITGAFTYDPDGFSRALALLASGRLPIDALLEPDDVPLAGALEAMRGLAEGRLAGKVLVKP